MTIGDAPFPLMQMPRVGGFAPPAELTRARESPAAGGMYRLRIPAGDLAWVVTRYDDVREVLADPDRFSSARRPDPRDRHDPVDEQAAAERRAGSLLTTDPPEHNRLRRMVAGEFTVRRIRDLTPRIVEIVDDHLNAMAGAGPPADLVRDFAVPVPSLVISELLGVPPADRAGFQDRARRQLDTLSVDERERVASESRAYMGELVDRARTDPGNDILGMLVARHGDDLTRAELIGIADLLLFAGHETTATMLAFGTLALLRHPDQRHLVRDDPSATAAAVEELLRFLSVTQTTPPRTATRDTVLAGHRISAGDILLLSLPAANRDPRFASGGAGADVLDVTRTPAPHLAFGYGVHHCLGAALARQEMAVAFPALLRRFPRLALDVAFDDVVPRQRRLLRTEHAAGHLVKAGRADHRADDSEHAGPGPGTVRPHGASMRWVHSRSRSGSSASADSSSTSARCGSPTASTALMRCSPTWGVQLAQPGDRGLAHGSSATAANGCPPQPLRMVGARSARSGWSATPSPRQPPTQVQHQLVASEVSRHHPSRPRHERADLQRGVARGQDLGARRSNQSSRSDQGARLRPHSPLPTRTSGASRRGS